MNTATIKFYDIANGEGVRTSLFVSGCRHHCKNCFNYEAWDFSFGEPYTEGTEQKILESLAPDYISGLSVLGGEPMEPENQAGVLALVKKVKERFPQKTVWMEEKQNISLIFRGSENQRVIDVQKTLASGKIALYIDIEGK